MADEARWEWPAGKLEGNSSALATAKREFEEETGADFPDDAELVGTWTSEDGEYQGFVFRIEHEGDIELGQPDGEEISAVAWWDTKDLDDSKVRGKVTDDLDRSEPILERAEKDQSPDQDVGGPPKDGRPGPGGHREELLVQRHAPKISQALAQQTTPRFVATTYGRLAGAPVVSPRGVAAVAGAPPFAIAATAAATAATSAGVIASFVLSLHLALDGIGAAILAMWADSWLAGAKDGRDSLDSVGVWVPADDALDRAVERVDWEAWTPGSPPPASSLPGFDDVRQRLAELISGITETTRDEIRRAIEAFVGNRVAHVPWTNDDVLALSHQIGEILDNAQRGILIARTEVNRAMTDAALDLFKRAGIAMFNLVTHPTACQRCKDVEAANPHPISDTSAMPPQHPNCRCSVSPVVV